jgi:hypothetical protein
MTVESLQHSAHPCPLLGSQSCVGRNRTAMQSSQKPINRFKAIEPIHTERDDCCCICKTLANELKLLAAAEVKQQVSSVVFGH